MLRLLVRGLLYAGPLLLAMAGGLLLATSLGSYTNTWHLIQRALAALAPDYPSIGDSGASYYQLNDALRKLAHVGVYACLTALTARLCQAGAPRLRRRTLPAAALVPALFMSAEAALRRHYPDRHVRPEQLGWNAAGIGIVVALTGLYFAGKALERWALAKPGAAPLQSGSNDPPLSEETLP